MTISLILHGTPSGRRRTDYMIKVSNHGDKKFFLRVLRAFVVKKNLKNYPLSNKVPTP